jgi:hypothetical protein
MTSISHYAAFSMMCKGCLQSFQYPWCPTWLVLHLPHTTREHLWLHLCDIHKIPAMSPHRHQQTCQFNVPAKPWVLHVQPTSVGTDSPSIYVLGDWSPWGSACKIRILARGQQNILHELWQVCLFVGTANRKHLGDAWVKCRGQWSPCMPIHILTENRLWRFVTSVTCGLSSIQTSTLHKFILPAHVKHASPVKQRCCDKYVMLPTVDGRPSIGGNACIHCILQ